MNVITEAPAVAPQTRPELDEVLRAVNAIRRERGLDAIYELPKGICGSGDKCVIARAFGADVVLPGGAVFSTRPHAVALPSVIGDFICDFDEGAYPELIA